MVRRNRQGKGGRGSLRGMAGLLAALGLLWGTLVACPGAWGMNADGDLIGDGNVDIRDALRALRIAVQLVQATPWDLAHGDVAPLVNGAPAPNGAIDISDALAILRKTVGLITWGVGEESVTAVLGGSVAAPDGTSLELPPGVLPKDMTVTLTPLSINDPTSFEYGGVLFGPNRTELLGAARVRVPLPPDWEAGEAPAIHDFKGNSANDSIPTGRLASVSGSPGAYVAEFDQLHFCGAVLSANCHAGAIRQILVNFESRGCDRARMLQRINDKYPGVNVDESNCVSARSRHIQAVLDTYFTDLGGWGPGEQVPGILLNQIIQAAAAGRQVALAFSMLPWGPRQPPYNFYDGGAYAHTAVLEMKDGIMQIRNSQACRPEKKKLLDLMGGEVRYWYPAGDLNIFRTLKEGEAIERQLGYQSGELGDDTRDISDPLNLYNKLAIRATLWPSVRIYMEKEPGPPASPCPGDTPPGVMTLLGSVNLPNPATGLQVVGNLAYVGDRVTGLSIVNVANPASPVVLGATTGFTTSAEARGVVVAGGYAYLGAGAFHIVDVSNPAAPVRTAVSGFNATCGHLALKGTQAFIAAGRYSFTPTGLFAIADTTDPTDRFKARSVGALEIPSGNIRSVALSGNYAFLVDNSPLTGNLYVVEISNPATPVKRSTLKLANSSGGPCRIIIDGSTAYIADAGSGLTIVDIADPLAPRILYVGLGGYYTDMAVAGGRAYLLDLYDPDLTGKKFLRVLDVSAPGQPRLLSTIETPGKGNALTLAGNRLFAAQTTTDGKGMLSVFQVGQ